MATDHSDLEKTSRGYLDGCDRSCVPSRDNNRTVQLRTFMWSKELLSNGLAKTIAVLEVSIAYGKQSLIALHCKRTCETAEFLGSCIWLACAASCCQSAETAAKTTHSGRACVVPAEESITSQPLVADYLLLTTPPHICATVDIIVVLVAAAAELQIDELHRRRRAAELSYLSLVLTLVKSLYHADRSGQVRRAAVRWRARRFR